MKKNFWSGRMKTILIAALVVAILAAVVLGLSSGASFFENVTGSILSPIRSAVAAIDRQFEKYYNYLFQYAKLESENAALQSKVLSMEEDIRTVEEITDSFRSIFPGDPCKGDFALFGYGVTHQ